MLKFKRPSLEDAEWQKLTAFWNGPAPAKKGFGTLYLWSDILRHADQPV